MSSSFDHEKNWKSIRRGIFVFCVCMVVIFATDVAQIVLAAKERGKKAEADGATPPQCACPSRETDQ
ncbi:hypothetical protein [Delftia acidovorans]|uniref:hypothetical protein n=1 Tax=Delftia acidovorans TaxID=80866 RepID=UPI00241D01CB|nr:hypothetical protein [Delftia acidovorans]